MAQLVADKITKYYKGQVIVNAVSLVIDSGEVVGLLGPNGAGKTTSFYIIVGFLCCDQGHILLDTIDLTNLPIHSRARLGISYLPQEASIFRGLTVFENIFSILEYGGGINYQEMVFLTEKILQELHIYHLRDRIGLSLSGGERRRVEIARALALKPAFILLDEPFAGVDPLSVLDIQNIVKQLCQRNIGVLITDHNVRETLGICDRAYILNKGHVIAEGNTEQVLSNQLVRNIYLGKYFRM